MMKEHPAYDNLPAKQSRWDLIPTSWPNLAHPINHTFGSMRHPLGDASQNLLERCPRRRHNSVATVETGDRSAEHLTRERPADSAPCFACCAVLRAALDRKDATVLLVITTFSYLRLVGLTIVAFSISHWLTLAAQRVALETGRYLLEHSAPNDRFSSGAINREFISRHNDVLLVVISCRFQLVKASARCSTK